jgi:flagellar biosynthesis/type III secretory pathway chaperone
MSADKLIECLNRTLKLHQSLYELATRKTEIIKEGDIDALSSMIKDENKHVMAINKLEDERKLIVTKIVSDHPIQGDEPALTDVIALTSKPEGKMLLSLREEINEQLSELKRVNQLNQELVHSSLQFVNYSLDLLMPRPQTINYNKPTNKGQTEQVKRSMFDSKA